MGKGTGDARVVPPVLSDDRDENWRPADDCLCDAAEEERRRVVSTVAPHDDVVDVVSLGVLDDRSPRFSDVGHRRYLRAPIRSRGTRFVRDVLGLT